ncbi:MAG: type II toxin-antitoxin system PemK/MazF family toxin [Bacilli bacterium]|nr:type II toxin-antitoxin system PemK/MazF family toxin [Bacilli bacterium]
MVKQGDIVFVDFDPALGHEQKGRRPAVVISNSEFISRTKGLAIMLPITSTIHPGFPLHVDLRGRTKTKGQILCEQPKVIDTNSKDYVLIESVPEDILKKVIDIVMLEISYN